MQNQTQTFTLTTLFALFWLTTIGQIDTAIKKNKYYFWLTVSTHESFSDNFDFLIGGQLGLNFSVNQKHFFQIKGYELITLDGFPLSEPTPDRLYYLKNLSAFYGFGKYRTNSFLIITSVGLSYGKAFYRGKVLYYYNSGGWFSSDHPVFNYDNYFYFGLPLNASFMFTRHLYGISFDLYANVHKHPDYGLTINYHLGKIRDRINK